MEETKEEEKTEVQVPVKVVLTKEQEAQMFKALAHKSFKDVGYDFGVHLMFPNEDIKVTQFVSAISKKIKKAPELWGISEDVVEVIQEALDKRSIRKNPGMKADLAIQEESFRDKLDMMRDEVAEIIFKKLRKYNTKKGIDDISMRDLKDLLATAIDKGRLLKGESTENIKKLSPLNVDDLSPEEALRVIAKARDAMIEGKK